MRKKTVRISKVWKWMGSWAERIPPGAENAVWIVYEVFTCAVLCGGGAIMTMDYLCRRWWSLALLAAIQLFLMVAIVCRNYWMRRLNRTRQQLLDQYQVQNLKLTNVTLAAIALMINIEHGLPPNLDALQRELAALQPEESPNLTLFPVA